MSGMSNNLVVTGASLAPDRLGTTNAAYYFDGLTAWMCSQNVLPISNAMPRTVSAWFRSQDASFYTGNPTIVGFGHMATVGDLFDIILTTSNVIDLPSDYQLSSSTNNIYLDNRWYHFVVTTTGTVGGTRAYLDGAGIAFFSRGLFAGRHLPDHRRNASGSAPF